MGGSPYATIGRIIKTHGVKGEVSFAVAEGLPPSCLENLTVWIVPPPHAVTETRVVSVRPGPKGPLVGLEGVDSVEEASEVAGCHLIARIDDLPDEWNEGPSDPIGMRVVDRERGEIGEIVDVIVTGANDVWVVKGDRYGEVLIPVIDQVILSVDIDEYVAHVALLRGLIEEETE